MRIRALTISIVFLLGGALASACSSAGTGAGGVPATSAGALGATSARGAHERIGTAGRVLNPQVSCSGAGSNSFVGGHDGNIAAGPDSGVLSGQNNMACGDRSGITAGTGNGIASVADFVGAGSSNAIVSVPPFGSSFIGAGSHNVLDNAFGFAILAGEHNLGVNETTSLGAVLGGSGNINYSEQGFIGAGVHNALKVHHVLQDTIVSGESNMIAGGQGFNFIGGGSANTIEGSGSGTGITIMGGSNSAASLNAAGASYSVVGGGHDNQTNRFYATVPGGAGNVANGQGSFAAGYQALALHDGTFVWSDDPSGAKTTLRSTGINQFLARATGGFTLYTNAGNTLGATLAAGSGSWASVSDRALKRRIVPVDDVAMLDRVASLPVSQWSYVSERGVRHLGPMAQDFSAAFGLGEDNRHIASIDEGGVALSAIKALHDRLAQTNGRLAQKATAADAVYLGEDNTMRSLRVQIRDLRGRLRDIDTVRAQVTELKARLSLLRRADGGAYANR